MTTPPAPISLYAPRWKVLLVTLMFAGLLLGGALSYFVWPTPAVHTYPWLYQEPTKTLFFTVWTLMCAALVAVGLYWTLTPRPLVQLSATAFVYRPFPRPTRAISWDDVEWLTAYRSRTSRLAPATTLTLRFAFRPSPLSTAQTPARLQLDIPMQLFSLSADELIELMSRYHPLRSLYTPKGLRIAMTAGRSGGEIEATSTTSTDPTSAQER
jgi:hypothetical protein